MKENEQARARARERKTVCAWVGDRKIERKRMRKEGRECVRSIERQRAGERENAG